jgi:hypothetical protein
VVTFTGEATDTSGAWWPWVLGGLAVWFVLAFLAAVIVGASIRLADRRSPGATDVLTTADLESGAVRQRDVVRTRRRAIPLSPLGIALILVALGLETTGFLTRLTGGGTTAGLLSMDAPFSLPRMYVAALFGAAALAALAGAGSLPGRRAWWTAVALVGGGIAVVKAGGTVHADAMAAVGDALGARAAVLLSALAALAVVTALWFLSRSERRDRRRVLGTLAGYAAASVGLSAVSASVPASFYATATFLEESGEALAGVAFLMAVLIGVAPRLVLPAGWPLRRTADAHTLDVPSAVPGRPVEGR